MKILWRRERRWRVEVKNIEKIEDLSCGVEYKVSREGY